ncbi:MAG: imidazole glycerol phosphate synthase subunit HisH [Clostridia bacterium]|nr:imidazole glycerol phosphate synthase subunit HisH [Clostridia bacterium]
MIVIVDYGVGNLFSLQSSFAAIGQEALVSADKAQIAKADKIILPGVGAFADAARKLRESGLDTLLCDLAAQGKQILGICLGMQLLFEESREFGVHKGLGLIPGTVQPIRPLVDSSYKIPHIGWNALHIRQQSPLFSYIEDGDYVYFVHSYYAAAATQAVIATTEYGAELTAAVQNGNVFGCQFHPEKSGEVGLKILRAFCAI